ncbi:MAG: tryptophan 7-halogenase, partial [Burkholderiaceae bacterium]|nr:tryptophan 7-halogenase [Burkholderiaceae bacterium]
MRHFDVVIIGAGPAGAATALSLRKHHPHLSVLLLEASDFQFERPGETLTLDAMPLLQQLEVFDFFLEQNHRSAVPREDVPARGPVSGVDAGGGWYLERHRFDSMLAGYAAASGAAFMRAALTRVRQDADGKWQMSAGAGAVTHTVSASFVVDASGRNARFATEIGVAQTAHDSLLSLTRIVDLDDSADAGTGCQIEAFEHGWWYSAPQAGRRMAVSVMTDADIGKRLQLSDSNGWNHCLDLAPQTRARIGRPPLQRELCMRAAHTRNLANYAGSNWLAVGDAASSIDPLGSQGVLRALRFGLQAGATAGDQFGSRRAAGLQDYAQLVQAEFDNHLIQRLEDYRLEQRWAAAPFWVRRHTPQGMPPHLAANGPRSTITLGSARASRS